MDRLQCEMFVCEDQGELFSESVNRKALVPSRVHTIINVLCKSKVVGAAFFVSIELCYPHQLRHKAHSINSEFPNYQQ